MKSQEEKELRETVEKLREANVKLLTEKTKLEEEKEGLQNAGMEMARWNTLLAEENEELSRVKAEIKKGAHDWKMRARAAEKRCRELLEERVKREDEYNKNLNILAGELADADKRLLELHEELQKTRFGREELRCELERVKAHAYDLMCGNRLNGEES